MKTYTVRKEIPTDHHIGRDLETYPELLRHLMIYRGIGSADQAEAFLNPDYARHVHDPYLMKDMEKVVERILLAIEKKERVVIYTDYDADGIPAGVILHDFFKKIGFYNFENYFPHRYEEGYGLNVSAIERFAGIVDVDDKVIVGEVRPQKTTLIITADCGIADVDPVKRANELGIDVIITDHHEPQEVLPEAYAILDPKQLGCNYPYKMLCGAGVVFKLVQAILRSSSDGRRSSDKSESTKNNYKKDDDGEHTHDFFGLDVRSREGLEKWLLDMVGLATMADMVPLTGENRVFAYYGLTVLRKSPRLGLIKLLRKIKVSQQHLSEDDIGYMLVPRINAASRMGLPMDAFDLLTATNDADADRMSDHLNKINDERKGLAAAIAKDIKKHLKDRVNSEDYEKARLEGHSASVVNVGNNSAADNDSSTKNCQLDGYDPDKKKNVLVIGNPNWLPPLLGPVANNIMETYQMPVFLWGRGDSDVIKGSCRSDGSISVVEVMQAVSPGIFIAFGGHRASGGFSVSHEQVHLLESELEKAYEKIRVDRSVLDEQRRTNGSNALDDQDINLIYIDKKITFDDVSWENYRLIEKLAPFGEANKKPLFLFENAIVTGVKHFGKDKNHLELQFERSDGSRVSAIGFFMTVESLKEKLAKLQLASTLEKGVKVNLVATMEKSVFRNFPELRLRIVDII